MLGAQAAYHGVPLVGIPMYGDQPDNIAKAVHRGFGLLVPAKHLQVGLLFQASLAALIALQSMPRVATHLHCHHVLSALLEVAAATYIAHCDFKLSLLSICAGCWGG